MSVGPRTWVAIAGCWVAASCVRLDASHCANLQGDATCAERDPARAHCSACTPTNDGCVAEPVEAECVPSLESSSTSEGDGSATIADDGGDASSVASDPSADDGASSTPTTSDVTATSASTNVGDDGVADGDAGSTSDDPGTTTTASDDDASDDDDTAPATMTDTRGESSDGGPFCGNGVREGDEQCDGDDLDGATCLEHVDFADGVLACDAFCMFNTTGCMQCAVLAGVCATDDACCEGHCNLNLCVL